MNSKRPRTKFVCKILVLLSVLLCGCGIMWTGNKGKSTGSSVSSAYQLVFTAQPSNVGTVGVVLPTGGTVQVQDSFGNLISSGSLASATITLTDGSKNGNLQGTTSVTAVGGIAAIPNNSLKFERGGVTSVLASTTVSGFTVTPATSNSITVAIPAMTTVSLLSGINDPNGDIDASGNAATLYYPNGVTYDGTYIYALEGQPYWSHSTDVIRRYTVATGAVTTWAGQLYTCGQNDGGPGVGQLCPASSDLVNDGTNIYFANGADIRKVNIATQVITTIAGVWWPPGYTDNAIGTNARFDFSYTGLWIRGTTLYISDTNNCVIRSIDLSNVNYPVSTFAGTGVCGHLDEAGGNPLTAKFDSPTYLTGDATYLYVMDTGTTFGIRRIKWATGNVDTLENTYTYSGFTIAGANFYGGIFEAIQSALVTTGATIATVAGQGSTGEVDGGSAVSYIDGAGAFATVGGNVYFSDSANGALRFLNTGTNTLSTVAGTLNSSLGQTDGAVGTARFDWPSAPVSDGTNLYVLQGEGGGTVARQVVVATGTASTHALAGLPNSPGGQSTVIGNTMYSTFDTGNVVYATDMTAWTSSVLAGTGVNGNTLGAFATAKFQALEGITNDGSNLYVYDHDSIKKLNLATQTVSLLSGTPGTSGCSTGTSGASQYGTGRGNSGPYLTYLNGFLYETSECFGGGIRRIDATTGASVLLVGNGTSGYTNGLFANAQFGNCVGNGCSTTTDGVNLYLYDYDNGTVRKIDLVAGTVSTYWGNPTQQWLRDGTIGGTALEGGGFAWSMLYYGYGKLYISNDRGIRVAQ